MKRIIDIAQGFLIISALVVLAILFLPFWVCCDTETLSSEEAW